MTQQQSTSNDSKSSDNGLISSVQWSQVSETVTLLNLATTLIHTGLHDSSKSVSHLTDSFTSMATDAKALNESISNLNSTSISADISAEQTQLLEATSTMMEKMGDAIVAFQFYDRLCQKLEHVNTNLSGLSELIQDPEKLDDPQAWEDIKSRIAKNYSMESERKMFQCIIDGTSVEDSIKIYREHFDEYNSCKDNDSNEDSIELF